MTTATDQSTPREWAEDISPLCEVRDIDMTKRDDKPLPGTYLAIEVYGPDGLQWQPCDSIGQLRDEAERAKRFGYELTAARAGGIGAFTPKVEPDELPQETPFDWPHTSLGERITMTPGTRAYEIEGHPTGYRWKFRDYATGRIYHARADEAQPDLRPVRSE